MVLDMQRTFLLNQVAPVPVDHRVQIVVYEKATTSLLLRSVEWQRVEDWAVIRDVETGIEYAPAGLFTKELGNAYFRTRDYVEDPLPDHFRPCETLLGRVRACRVVIGGTLDFGCVTRLAVDV